MQARRSQLPGGTDVGARVEALKARLEARAEHLERASERLRLTELRTAGLRERLEGVIAVAEARLQSASSRNRVPRT
jgi:hypothetical protein